MKEYNVFGDCTIYDGGLKRKIIVRFDGRINLEVQNFIYLFIKNASNLGATFGYILSTIPIAYDTYKLRVVIDYEPENYEPENILLTFVQKK